MIKKFTEIYESKLWGDNRNDKYHGSSGGGSCINYNIDTYIPFIKKFITNNKIKTVIDLGCGDFACGSLIYDDLDILYTGYDAYKKVIDYNSKTYDPLKYNFYHLDFCNSKEEILSGDLCILKDVLQHWETNYIYKFLDYVCKNKIFKYILITNCCDQMEDNSDLDKNSFRHLSCKFLPLKKI